MLKLESVIYFVSYLIYKAILKGFFGFEVKGAENVPEKGPFIIASNHVSYADPTVIAVTCNTAQIFFIAKHELFNIPVFGLWVRAVGSIKIERNSHSSEPLRKAVNRLREGRALGMFPEGRRSTDGNLQKAQPGMGFIAAKSGAPVIPVYISGTDKVLPKGRRWVRFGKITAKVGKPVDLQETLGIPEKRKAYEAIGEKVMGAIARLKDE